METDEEFYNRINAKRQIDSNEEKRFLDIFSTLSKVPRKNCLWLDKDNWTVKTNTMSITVEM